MLLNLKKLIEKYKLDITGVLHIGGHTGEEIPLYQELNIENVTFFEPDPRNVKILDEKVENTTYAVMPVGLGSKACAMEMHISSNDHASNSVLKPKLHLKQYPNITFNQKIMVNICKLDDFYFDLNPEYNFINIDIQGYELEALKGSEKTLENIDAIICEVNRNEVYENCPHVNEIDEYLKRFGFERKETSWDGVTWGDAVYIKS